MAAGCAPTTTAARTRATGPTTTSCSSSSPPSPTAPRRDAARDAADRDQRRAARRLPQRARSHSSPRSRTVVRGRAGGRAARRRHRRGEPEPAQPGRRWRQGDRAGLRPGARAAYPRATTGRRARAASWPGPATPRTTPGRSRIRALGRRSPGGCVTCTGSSICAASCTSRCATCARRWRSCSPRAGTARRSTSCTARATPREILSSFYFNSWLGAPGTADRLLRQLRELDVAAVPEPALDRKLAAIGPAAGQGMMTIDQRGDYDLELLATAVRAARAGRARVAGRRGARRRVPRGGAAPVLLRVRR